MSDPTEGKITLDLNVFDDEGNIVDGTTAELTRARISDIIDHAAELILAHRQGRDIALSLAELDEAMTVADVISDPDDVTPAP